MSTTLTDQKAEESIKAVEKMMKSFFGIGHYSLEHDSGPIKKPVDAFCLHFALLEAYQKGEVAAKKEIMKKPATNPLTIAYLAIGIMRGFSYLSEKYQEKMLEQYQGEANMLKAVLAHAEFLDAFQEKYEKKLKKPLPSEILIEFAVVALNKQEESAEDIIQNILRIRMKKQDFEAFYDEESPHVPYRVRLAIGAGKYMAQLSEEKAYTLYQFSMEKYAELLASLDEKVDIIFSLDTKTQAILDALLSEWDYDWVEAFGAALISRDDDDAAETLRWVLEHSPLPQNEFAKIYG